MAVPIIGAVLEIGGKLIDKLIPDPAAKAEALLKLKQLEQTGELAVLAADTQLALGQIEVNKIEAADPNIFKSGWRPGAGWVCVLALASQYVLGPLVEWASDLFGARVLWPVANSAELTALLLGMLGLGAMRTTEKLKDKG